MSQEEWFSPDMEFKVGLMRNTHTLAFSGNGPLLQGLPSSSAGKESACNAEDSGAIPGLARSRILAYRIPWTV